ncbi:MAG: ABC transporter permease [Myxococcales bacterium]|nr:ABC transporter permease [Myxococcales bacterium]
MLSLFGVALRNIVRSPRRSLLVSLAVIGGCAALVFMLSMNNGLAQMMVTNSVGLMLGHVQVDAPGARGWVSAGPVLAAAAEDAAVRGAAPRLDLPVLMGQGASRRGALVLGVVRGHEAATSTFPSLVTRGRIPGPDEGDAVALGVDLARSLGVTVGADVSLVYFDAGERLRPTTLRVVGLVRAGSEDLDDRLALVPLATVQGWLSLDPGLARRVVLRARENRDTEAVAGRLRARLGPGARVRTWGEVSPFLQAMVNFQHGSANVVLMFLYIVVGAGVAAIQLMSILERTRELGVLASIGFSPRRVVALVALETLLLGSLAVACGLGLGYALVTLVGRLGGIDVRVAGGVGLEGLVGMDPHLVPVFSRKVFAYTAGVVGPVLLLGGVLPGLRAARMTPMEALRRP